MPALVFAARSLLTRTAALRSSVKPAAAATATAQLWRCMSSASASLADAPSCGPAIPETEKVYEPPHPSCVLYYFFFLNIKEKMLALTGTPQAHPQHWHFGTH